MSSIELTNLTKRFGDLVAVNNMDLEIKDKEFVALLGPSGCGKTTTMNMIAGIELPSDGHVSFDGNDITNTPMGKRGVGFVFQNYAIFIHMTVYKNLAFGLEVSGTPRGEIDQKVDDMAKLMRLTRQLDWPAERLSVNELQRLAIGRSAIVRPNIFLLDEPLSNLDAAFRAEMRTELKHLQHELEQTMVYVTHDQLEAMSMADRIAIMDMGILQQYGSPIDVYNRPENSFVARFIGAPSMNLLDGRIVGTNGSTKLDFGDIGNLTPDGNDPLAQACQNAQNSNVLFGVRPEDLKIQPSGSSDQVLSVKVTFIELIGPRSIIHVEGGGHQLKVVSDNQETIEIGTPVGIAPTGRTHLFDADSGQRVE
mgnify:CR=1 FL=1|tara:strand:+ start:1591 stop:2688 length:1098 start_codon:yes stop_codon:yes gene_type:complete